MRTPTDGDGEGWGGGGHAVNAAINPTKLVEIFTGVTPP